jgi:hypothetical protein
MLKYNEWKQLNENFGGPIPLGLGRPNVVGLMGAHNLEEAAKKGKKKMFGDVEPEEEPEDEEPEDEEEDEPKGKCDEKPEKEPEEGDETEKEPEEGDEKPDFLMSKKKSKCKSCKKSKKKMTKEEQEWYNSVMGQIGSNPNEKHWDGFSEIQEDSLVAPSDPNAGLADNGELKQAQPGEVGYAPVQRVGGWFS